MAWALPVIAVAAAAPAFAASACPTISVVNAAISGPTRHRVTVINLGPVAIPSGTTITWQIRNVRTNNTPATFSLSSLTGVVASTAPTTIARNALVTITFTTTTAIAVAAGVSWAFALSSLTYNSRATMTFSGALAGCPPSAGCVSGRGTNSFGVVCPT